MDASTLANKFNEGTKIGLTPVTHGIALPHFRLEQITQAEMVLVRAVNGVHIKFNNPITGKQDDEATVKALFFLVSPEQDPTQHLRILAQIAGRVDDENFALEWEKARSDQELKEALLHDERLLTVHIDRHEASAFIIDKALKDLHIPKGCLVAFLRREGETIVPDGNTIFKDGDHLTVIGDPRSLDELRTNIQNHHKGKKS